MSLFLEDPETRANYALFGKDFLSRWTEVDYVVLPGAMSVVKIVYEKIVC